MTEENKSTTLVGVVAQNGVVMATDKQVTKIGGTKSKVRKLEQIHPEAVISTAGSASAAQILTEKAKKQIELYKFERGRKMSLENAYKKVSKLTRNPSLVAPIFAGYDGDEKYLSEYSAFGSETQHDDFVSVGSGSKMALGSLESEYEEDLRLEQAEEIAINALANAAEHGIFTGEGIDIARIDEDGVRIDRNVREL